jgi:hypothetical protein
VAAEGFEARLRAAASRVRERAGHFEGQRTAPDPPTGEQWDRGQVLSHIAEFLPYWVDELELVIAAGGQGHGFGRTKQTPSRLARIEAGRHNPADRLLGEMDAGVERAAGFINRLQDAQWDLEGTHPTLGKMSVAQAVDEFIVGHLQQHADQMRDPDQAPTG